MTRRTLPPSYLLLLLGLVFYAFFLARFMGACASGADQSGYLNEARLLAEGRVSIAMRAIPIHIPGGVPLFTHIPLGFNPNPDGSTLNPIYPPGLPLLIMAVAKLAGWNVAPGVVMGLHALLGLLLMYWLGKAVGLNAGLAWLGSLLLAASPLFILLSLQTMSDVPAMVWVTAAVLSAWRSRRNAWLALAAGMGFSIAVLVRPTDSLAIVPIAIVLGLSWRRWLAFAAGGLPGAIFQCAFNVAAYGRMMTTGYGDMRSFFSWSFAPATLGLYILWLPVVLTPLVVLSVGLPALRRHASFAWLAAWVAVYPAFYLFYSYTHNDWWGLRFVLPAFPPLAVASLLVGERLCTRLRIRPRAGWLAPAAAAVLLHGALWAHHLHAFSVGRSEKVYPETAAWLQDHLPSDAVVTAMQASGSLFYYTKFPVIRWDAISPGDFQRITAACMRAGLPVYAALFPFESKDARWEAIARRLPGRWTQVGAVRQVSIWRYLPPAPAH
jgi:hypothetical protein